MTLLGSRLFFEFPLLRKELVGLLRTRRALLLLLFTVGLSSLLPLLAWPSRMSAGMAWVANTVVFVTFFLTQLTAALLAIPAFTAGAISGERERDTYDLLYTTLLSPLSIVISKALASVGYVAVLLAASAPSACVFYLLGGIGFDTIIKCYVVTFASVAMSGLVCLSSSMNSERTAKAAVRGIFGVAFWNGGLVFVLYVLGWVTAALLGFPGRPSALLIEAAGWVLSFTPYFVIPATVMPETMGIGTFFGARPFAEPWTIFLCYCGAISLWQLLFLLRRVRVPGVPPARRKWFPSPSPHGKPARAIRRVFTARWLIAAGEAGVPLLRNPVFLKEVRSEFFARPWFRRALFWPTLLFCGLLSLVAMNRADFEGSVMATSLVAAGLILLFVPGVAASALPREIEQGNLDFLRGTLIRLPHVVAGKFLASLYSCSGILAAAFWVFLLLYAFHRSSMGPSRSLDVLLTSAAILCVTLLSTTTLATLASVLSTRTLKALLLAYLSLFVLYVLLPAVATVLLDRLGPDSVVIAMNPMAALVIALPDAGRSGGHDNFALFLGLQLLGTLAVGTIAPALVETLRGRDV